MFFSGNKRRIEIDNGSEWQTEGVAFVGPKRVFISCETTDFIPASLYNCDENWLAKAAVVEEHRRKSISCYPNPVKDVISIDHSVDYCGYIIFNMAGYAMQNGDMLSGGKSIDVTSLAAGTYILELCGKDGKRYAARIMKQ